MRNNAPVNPVLFHILLGLKDDPQDAEGIVSRIRALGQEKEPPLASFYRALKKALDEGYLEILDAEDAGRRGRPRQRYRITRWGRSALAAEARRLGRLAKLALGSAGVDRE
jgi:DNA-binding PadR family transcriptional regulator